MSNWAQSDEQLHKIHQFSLNDCWSKFLWRMFYNFLILRLRLRSTVYGRSFSGPNIRLRPKVKIGPTVQHWRFQINSNGFQEIEVLNNRSVGDQPVLTNVTYVLFQVWSVLPFHSLINLWHYQPKLYLHSEPKLPFRLFFTDSFDIHNQQMF